MRHADLGKCRIVKQPPDIGLRINVNDVLRWIMPGVELHPLRADSCQHFLDYSPSILSDPPLRQRPTHGGSKGHQNQQHPQTKRESKPAAFRFGVHSRHCSNRLTSDPNFGGHAASALPARGDQQASSAERCQGERRGLGDLRNSKLLDLGIAEVLRLAAEPQIEGLVRGHR